MPTFTSKQKRLIPLGLFVLGLISAVVLSFKNNYWGITSEDYNTLACVFLHVRRTYLEYVTVELQTEGVYKGLFWFFDHNAAFYLYLSYLALFLQVESSMAFLYAQFVFIMFLMGVFPTLIYKITQRISLSLASIVLFFCMSHLAPASMFQINDCYWAYYLILAIGMPVLYILITNEWSRSMWYYTFLLCFTVSVCDLVRSSASILIWISLLVIVIYKNAGKIKTYCKTKNVKLLAILLGIFVVWYSPNLFTDTVPDLYLLATGQDVSARLDTMGPWHSLYIGLGWMENPDGIYYDDTCGYNLHPDTLIDAYLPQTEAYIEAIKGSYFEAITGHPFVYFLSYLVKALQSLVMGIRPMIFFGLAFVLIKNSILALLAGGLVGLAYCAAMWYMLRYCLRAEGKAILKKLLPLGVLGVISLINGMLPALVAMPTYVYIAGVVGAYDIFVILALFITAAHYFTLKKENKPTL